MIQQFKSKVGGGHTDLKRHMHPYVYFGIICNSQDMEATQVSINRWMVKDDVVYMCVCVCLILYLYDMMNVY